MLHTRKCAPTTPPNTCNTKDEQARLYPDTHKGPAYIKIKIAPGKEKKSKAFNLMYMAKAISSLGAEAHSIQFS